MTQMFDDFERAAIWFMNEARAEGLTLKEIADSVLDAYGRQGVTPYPPHDWTPDGVTVWLSDCWRNHGLHVEKEDAA